LIRGLREVKERRETEGEGERERERDRDRQGGERGENVNRTPLVAVRLWLTTGRLRLGEGKRR
jgi:hypothetical protein